MKTRLITSIRKRLGNESGQLFLISVLLLVVLVLTVGVVVFINQSGVRSGVATQNRTNALAVAQEGLAYASHILAMSTTTWQNAQAGNFPAEFTDAGGPHVYSDSSGGIYTVQCSTGGTLQSYEVQVLIKAGSMSPATGQPAYTRALQAGLSQMTVAVGLPTGVQAGSALSLMYVPQITPANGLQVDWGPIGTYDPNLWTVSGLIDADQYPRKFSVGNIKGSVFLRSEGPNTPNTDQEEYWANSSLGFPGTIDLATYQNLAQNSAVPSPNCAGGGSCTANPANSGYFNSVGPASTATFTVAGGWAAPNSTAVVYIDGNADFEDVAIDLKNTGAFIVTGNLTLGNPLAQSIASNAIRVPNTALLEYYYQSAQCPCSSAIGQTCTIAQATRGASNTLQYRGFLYVMGNLIVPNNTYWVLDGTVRVDGTILVQTGGTLQVLYDDQINRSILVTPVNLMIDSLTTVPAS